MKNLLCFLFFVGYHVIYSQSKLTEVWEPVPNEVNSFSNSSPPSDAIVLFDGSDFSKWETWGNKEPEWIINEDGSMTVVNGKGSIFTKESFGSV